MCPCRPWTALLELLAPETCVLCAAGRSAGAWCGRGPRVSGVRVWDETHLCAACAAGLATGPVVGCVGGGASIIPVWAATATSAAVTAVLGAWKYRGVRGLAWPLADLLATTLRRSRWPTAAGGQLVPVPLHRARRRDRGFNQSEVLARLVAAAGGPPVRTDLLRRIRSTAQQAQLADPRDRAANLAGAFGASSADARPGARSPLILVDDVVTTGATVLAARAALENAGWSVAGVLALAAARATVTGGRVDTPGRPA